jgi:CHASE2 domain-containing sensor protein
MQKTAAFLMVTVLLLGLFLMGQSREGTAAAIEAAYGDWVATNTSRVVPPARVALVEINDSSIGDHPWPWAPTEYTLFLQAVLPFKPDVIAIEPTLDWQGVSIPGESPQKMQQDGKFLHDYILQAPKIVLGSQLGSPDDPDTVPPLQPVPLLRNVKGDLRAIPVFTDIPEQAAQDYRLDSSVGFANLPPDQGKIIRKAPLVFNYRGEIVPSFILQTLIQWFKLTPDDVTVEPGSHIQLGNSLAIPIDLEGRMNIDFSSTFTRFGHDDLLLAVAEQQHGDKSAPAISTDALKGGIVILARTDRDSRTLLTPSRASESYGELSAAAIATVLNKAFSRRVSPLFDFAVIAAMMALGCFFHRFQKRSFIFLSFVILLGYLFLSMSLYALLLVRLPFILPTGLMLLLNFFSLFFPRDASSPAPASAPQPS